MVFLLAVCGVLALAGCGGSSSPSTISGQVIDGPIANAKIRVYALNSDGSTGGLLGQTTTDGSGKFSVNTGSYSGNSLVEASGGTYTDEYTGRTVNNNGTLHAAVTGVTPGSTITVVVTPMTELAVQYAGSALTTANIKSGDAAASALLGNVNIMATTPSGKYVYVANYRDNDVSQYTIGADGSLTPMSTATVAAGLGPYSVIAR